MSGVRIVEALATFWVVGLVGRIEEEAQRKGVEVDLRSRLLLGGRMT